MNRTVSVGLAFAVIIIAAFAASAISGQKKPAERQIPERVIKQVKVLPVENETLRTEFELTGRLMAKQKVEIFAEVGGTLLPNGNRFREGNYFKKGQALLKIDNEEPKLALLAQKSALMNQITLMLPDLKSDYEESFPNWESYLNELDLNEDLPPFPEALSDREKYFVSSRNLYNLYYSIKSQESRLGKYRIPAPFAGVVSTSQINEGTLVRAGQKMGEFMNTYTYELEAAVNESEVDMLKVGSVVALSSDASRNSWKGTISRISQVVDPSTQTIKVFITTSGKGLKAGMYLTGQVKGEEVKNAFEIPRNLLIDQENLFVVEDSVLDLVPVKPVHLTTRSAIIQGLDEGTLLLGETFAGAYKGLQVDPQLNP